MSTEWRLQCMGHDVHQPDLLAWRAAWRTGRYSQQCMFLPGRRRQPGGACGVQGAEPEGAHGQRAAGVQGGVARVPERLGARLHAVTAGPSYSFAIVFPWHLASLYCA